MDFLFPYKVISYIANSEVVFSTVAKVIKVLHFRRVQIEPLGAETLLLG